MSHEISHSYVYLSPLADETAFKIGRANIPSERLRNLSEYHGLHPTLTWLVECADKHSALMLEGFLHRVLREFSVPRESDGGTEFYQMVRFGDCRKIAAAYAEAHGFAFTQYSGPKNEQQDTLVVDSLNELKAKIRSRRLACNLRQAELARRVGVSLATYKRFERVGEDTQIALGSFLSILNELGLESSIKSIPKEESFRQRARNH